VFNLSGYKRDANQTTLRFQLTPVEKGHIQGQNNNKYWQECLVKQEPLYTVGENTNSTTIMESRVEIPQKAKVRTAM
jgi:hypothetical protein